MSRFERNIRLFGAAGQARLHAAHIAIVGCGGLGEHVVQQLACLGVGAITLVDDEELSESNRNRYILAEHLDAVPGTHKVDIALRAIRRIDPDIEVNPVRAELRRAETFDALRRVGTIFGCLDNDGARLVLNEFALAYGTPYFDLATDVEPGKTLRYGGRVSLVNDDPGCLVCCGAIDVGEARNNLESAWARRDRAAVYGVHQSLLAMTGPSVVSINAIVSSLAVTEFMALTTGLRPPCRHLTYRAHMGSVHIGAPGATADCYYCNVVRNSREGAGVERYLPNGLTKGVATDGRLFT